VPGLKTVEPRDGIPDWTRRQIERSQRVVHVVTLGMNLVAGREVGIQTAGRGRGFIDILWLRNYNLV